MSTPMQQPSPWTDEFLDSMRQVTDPEADRLIASVVASNGEQALIDLKKFTDNWDNPVTPDLPQAIQDFFRKPVEFPAWVDCAKVDKASDLFVSYGPVTTVVLLLNAVPHFFTNPAGARSFYLAKVFGAESVQNRMIEVPQFVINITVHGGLTQTRDPANPSEVHKGLGVLTAQKLRVAHASIRHRMKLKQATAATEWNLQQLGEPINQEDLAEALMDFALWTNEGLTKLGIDQTLEEQEAVLHAWKVVGFLLGLRDELQPANVQQAIQLRDLVAKRNTKSTPEAASLIAEMLGIVQGFLPFFLRRFQIPAGLMRYQLGDEVADIVGVPNARLVVFIRSMLAPLWEKDKVFAKFAEWLSPHFVKWLVEHPRIGAHKSPFHIPPRLAKSWGLSA